MDQGHRREMEAYVSRWSEVARPNDTALRAVDDLAAAAAALRPERGRLAFEDEPSGFEAALRAEADPGVVATPAEHAPGDPSDPTLCDAADAFRRGEVRAEALVEAALARVAARDGVVNAVIRLDADRARALARAQDQARDAGRALGKLAGVVAMHKDMYYRAGEVSTCGSAIRRDWRAPVTATVLARLDAAGSIDMGTLNMSEFAQSPTGHNAHFGDCRNPWNTDHAAGGSSSGPGAAVAAGYAMFSLGSDTGGSIRLPAAMCGVTGIKPTQTRVSRAGVMPLSFSMDNVGPLARTARDAARVLRLIAGGDPADPTCAGEAVPDYEAALDGDLRGEVVVVPDEVLEGTEPSLLAAFEAALRVLEGRGARVLRMSLPVLAAVGAQGSLVSRCEAAAIHGEWMRGRAGEYATFLSARMYGGFAVPAHLYLEALSRRGPILRAFCRDAFRAGTLVAVPGLRLPTPTLRETDVDADPDTWDRFNGVSGNTRMFNYLGLPAVCAPCGVDGRGMPVGIQLAARPFGEARVLRAADALQRDTGWHLRRPG